MNKKTIGGQAVMEGVMMRSPTKMAIAVRKEDGSISIARHPVAQPTGWRRWPLIRGVLNFISMLKMGTETLNESLTLLGIDEEEPNKFEKWLSEKTGKSAGDIIMVLSTLLAAALCIGVFFLIPTLAATWLGKVISSAFVVNLLEGVVRLLIFLGYVLAISLMPDIRRFFAYHGAEHKVVNCYEAGLPLNVDNADRQTTLNPRCGTSFLLIVMLISVLIFSLTGWSGAWWSRFLIRLALLPIVAAVSYEVLMLLAKHDNIVTRILRWPGMQLQRLTTRKPDRKMLEVSLAAFISVLEPEDRAACVPEDYRLPDEPAPEEAPCEAPEEPATETLSDEPAAGTASDTEAITEEELKS